MNDLFPARGRDPRPALAARGCVPGRTPGIRFASRLASIFLLALVLGACSSPNRGIWEGSFEGNLSGTMSFEINTTGTKLTGSMQGKTESGAPFSAELAGRLRDQYFYASFEGTSRSGAIPVAFEGLMTGKLAEGEATGDWQTTLTLTGNGYKGTWRADQVIEE